MADYASLAAYPSIDAARFDPTVAGDGKLGLLTITNHRDLSQLTRRRKLASTIIDDAGRVVSSGFPGELEGLMSSFSPSTKYLALIRKTEKDQKVRHFLEIWQKASLIASIETTDQHGDVYADEFFGCLSWSPNETHIAFVAETKEKDDKSKPKPGTSKFEHKETWGEAFGKKANPALVVVDLQAKVATSLAEKIPGNPGQVIFSADGKRLIFGNLVQEIDKLGVVYCTNRPGDVQVADLNGDNLETIAKNVGKPRFLRENPNGERLIFFANEPSGPHYACSKLYEYSWKTKQLRIVIDLVQKSTSGTFPGLYPDTFPENCWLSPDDVLFSSVWRSKTAILHVNLPSGEIRDVTPDLPECGQGTFQVFEVSKGVALARVTSINLPPTLIIGTLEGNKSLKWKMVKQEDQHPLAHLPLFEKIRAIDWSIITHPDQPDLEAILVKPAGNTQEKSPLVLMPHGGPHSVFTPDFYMSVLNFTLAGYGCLLVNYRGSTGFGQEPLLSLPGKIGTQEIAETHQMGLLAVERFGFDADRIFLFGGSHGGFTVGNLIGQYPGFYAAAVMRNPVTNIASMIDGTDIPDWCCFEAGISDKVSLPTASSNEAMWSCSPVAHVSKVKTPTMILVGEDDKRVPPYQGKSFYQMLKRQGVKTKLIVYAGECHPIGGVEAEQDTFKMTLAFFEENPKR